LVEMSENGEQPKSLMEASGMGLFPGIMVALAIVMAGMALLLLGRWWALAAALLVLIGAAAAITLVVIAVMGEGEADERLRRRIPGLGPRRARRRRPEVASPHGKVAAVAQSRRVDRTGADMSTWELYVAGGARHWTAVRWELFVFPDVRDVAPTADPDRVRVVFRGEPQPERWRAALREAGFEVGGEPGPA
jgi:hypothetical protein